MFGIKIDNFRSLSDQQFNFSRVNVLIGENSSGKSSLIKFLRLLKRSVNLNASNFRYTSDIGNYKDFIYNNKENLNISFSLQFGNDYIDFFSSQLGERPGWKAYCKELQKLESPENSVELEFSFDKDIQTSNIVKTTISNPKFGKIEIVRHPKDEINVIRGLVCDLKIDTKSCKKKVTLKSITYEQSGFLTITSGSEVKGKIEDNDSLPNEVFKEVAFLLIAQNFVRELLFDMSYVNPISSTPERVYKENERQGTLYEVSDIKDVVNILTDESYDAKVRKQLLASLNSALRSYGILHQVDVSSSEFGGKGIKVKVNEHSVWSNIKDVGYGSSLQIPMIFQAILGEKYGGETMIIEQPEVHIHPYLQAKFIETIISIGPKNKYIIETHSSDLIRKLQVMVKKKQFDLSRKDVQIYYFKKPEDISVVSEHVINEHGKLLPKFPSGFYDSSINLVKELL